MSKLGKFLGKAEEIEIEGEKLKVYPLKVKDLELFAGKEKASEEEKLKMNRIIIKRSLRDEEGVTDEEIDGMSAEAFTKIMATISKINGFDDERNKQAKAKAAGTGEQ